MLNEIGTLRALSNGDSSFVGSSSGVFFINTVRRAFSRAVAASAAQRLESNDGHVDPPLGGLPSPEDCIVGSEGDTVDVQSTSSISNLGQLPSLSTAKELLMTYFKTWHPFVPFLHGPSCIRKLEALYTHDAAEGNSATPKSLGDAIAFQCVFNIAKLDRPDLPSLDSSAIASEEQLMNALSTLLLKSDMAAIQAMLAVQLYLVATMSLRAASSVGGLLMRSIFKAGLHRCPFRYASFDDDERDLRKRVFWSAYTLDRYITHALGHPLGIQDSDIDVCFAGRVELHQPVISSSKIDEGISPEEAVLHLPANHPHRHQAASQNNTNECDSDSTSMHEDYRDRARNVPPDAPASRGQMESRTRQENQFVQAEFVRYSRLVGRMVEMFHKSIHARAASRQSVIVLKTDIDTWGNELQYTSDDEENGRNGTDSTVSTNTMNSHLFFEVAHQHLLLLVNRPSLSLDPASPEFRHAIQACISAGRRITRVLEKYTNTGQMLFWPGFMSATWMSGLVMAFACQLRLHRASHAISDISGALRVLHSMSFRWKMARNCHDVLEMLLHQIQGRSEHQLQSPKTTSGQGRSARSVSQHLEQSATGKRAHQDPQLGSIINKRQHRRTATDGSDFRPSSAFGSTQADSVTQTPMAPYQGLVGMHSQIHSHPTFANAEEVSYSSNTAVGQTDGVSTLQEVQQPWPVSAHAPTMHSTQPFEQNTFSLEGQPMPAFDDHHGGEWIIPTDLNPAFGSTAAHDVFAGAAWGSLLDIMDPVT